MSDPEGKKFFVVFEPREADDSDKHDVAIVTTDRAIAKLAAERILVEDEMKEEVVVGEVNIIDVAVRSKVRWTKPKKGDQEA